MNVIKVIELRPYRKQYFNYLILVCAIVTTSFIMLKTGLYVGQRSAQSVAVKDILYSLRFLQR